MPKILNHVTGCDYTKYDTQEWFWERLAKAIQTPFAPLRDSPVPNMEEITYKIEPNSVDWSNSSISSQGASAMVDKESSLTTSSSDSKMHPAKGHVKSKFSLIKRKGSPVTKD